MPSANTIVNVVVLAALILPAWLVWRIPSFYISLPIAALLSCWLLVIAGVLPPGFDPDYDGIGAGMTILIAPYLSIVYTLILFAIRRVSLASNKHKERRRFIQSERRDALVGLVVWVGLCAFCAVYPFFALPRACISASSFLTDYFFFFGPILLLTFTMSLIYVFHLCQL